MATTPVRHITFDDEYFLAPADFMHDVAASGPIHRFSAPQGLSGWMVTSYELAKEVFVDGRVIKTPETNNGSYLLDTAGLSRRQRFNRWANSYVLTHMLGSDGPEHGRLRRVVAEPFTPRGVAGRASRITEVADQLLDRMDHSGPVELLGAFGVPLPVRIAAEVTGVPVRHADAIARCSAELGDFMLSSLPELRDGVVGFARMIVPNLIRRRFAPRDDVLSTIAAAHRRGEISFKEATSTASLILLAAHEAVTPLLLNTVYALLTNPDEMVRAKADPKALDAIIDETLRMYAPQPVATLRVAAEPLTLAGQEIRAGEWIWISLLAAHYDPDANACPYAFDSTRKPRRSLPFGYGVHTCLGAQLARTVTRIGVSRLLARFPDIALAADPDELPWRRGIFFRRMTEMPVTLG
ncbi:cytochrome P450 [Nocardia sp. NPDC088792]|uniref:cytochrome P450 n=1 Tax=Nocardia sp. NPDC088792 TaxID=3364332 RepID=UPI0038046719